MVQTLLARLALIMEKIPELVQVAPEPPPAVSLAETKAGQLSLF